MEALLIVILSLIVFTEVGLRLFYGFGTPLIYIEDSNIGYLLAPNQKTRRFGNRIEINQYSMRSKPISIERSPQTHRILLLGDSIANGGWWTDQADTLSSRLERHLETSTAFPQIEVLNASANSWCPRNELAYLQRFGTFNSQLLILLINTDDLFGTHPTSLPVGRDRNYPKQKPPLALIEVFTRYLLKEKPIPEMTAIRNETGDRVGFNLEAISKIQNIVTQNNGQLLLAMTPLLREIATEPLDYELKARQRLSKFTQLSQINYIDFLPIFNSQDQPQALYQDTIHLNSQGNQLVCEVLARSVLE
jgi:GDSL-like Lipase/Acylhydrolase family